MIYWAQAVFHGSSLINECIQQKEQKTNTKICHNFTIQNISSRNLQNGKDEFDAVDKTVDGMITKESTMFQGQ